MLEQLIRDIGAGIPVDACPPSFDKNVYFRLRWELGKALMGETKSLQSQIDASRCTESLQRYIKQHGYRGEQNV